MISFTLLLMQSKQKKDSMQKRKTKRRAAWNPKHVEMVFKPVREKREKLMFENLGRLFYDEFCQFSEKSLSQNSPNFSGSKKETEK